MRPGSPFAFGRVAALGGIPWFGLPGNPVSSMITFEVLARPALLRMAGHDAVFPPWVSARFAGTYAAPAGLTHFVRVRMRREAGVGFAASLAGPQGSGILTSVAAADALLVVPETAAGAAEGDVLTAAWLGGAPLGSEAGW